MSNKNKNAVDKLVKASLSVVVASTLFSTPLSVFAKEQKQKANNDGAKESSAIQDLLAEMKAENNIPTGESLVSYTNNYQSMEEEAILYRSGKGSAEVNNGLRLSATELGTDKFVAAWEKSPYVSSGVMSIKFSVSKAADNGFIIKSSNKDAGIAIRHQSGGVWVIQNPSTAGAWTTTPANPLTELKANEETTMQIGFYKNRLVITINGNEIYNGTVALDKYPNFISSVGQFGVYSRQGGTTFAIKEVAIEGVGTAKKPSINYQNDFEKETTPNWSAGVTPTIVDDGTGNKVLNLKATKDGRVTDLDSPLIGDGTISLDYKVKKLGSGFAFGFRYGDEPSSAFNELGVDGANAWIPEASSGWGSNLGLPAPVAGKWNNMMINFQGKTIRIYLNKELVGETTFDKFSTTAGKFGMRLRNTEIQIDNMQYTDEILTPKALVEYNNDFQDKITGNWKNATSSIIDEGSNRILQLHPRGDALMLNEDSPSLSEGSASFKMKSSSKNIGFKIANGEIRWKDNRWVLVLDGDTVEYPFTTSKASFEPLTKTWNRIGVQFTQSSVTLSVNGISSTINDIKVREGKFGILADANVYVDDLIYSEKTMDLNTSLNTDKMFYEEYYETETNINYTGLGGQSVVNGILQGSIAPGTTAQNSDVKEAANGLYQIKMESDLASAGMQIGNTKVYSTADGVWYAKTADAAPVQLGTSKSAVRANEQLIVSATIVEGKLTLSMDGVQIGTTNLKGYVGGSFGVYNPTANTMNVKIDEIAAEEIRIYEPTYAADDALSKWSNTQGSVNFKKDSAKKQIVASMNGDSMSLDKGGYAMLDQHVSFDFATSVDASANGGRYGILLRGVDNKKYVALEHDITGNWRVKVNGSDYAFKKTLALEKNKDYRFDVDLVGTTISLKITDPTSKEVYDMGSLTIEELPSVAGHFGVRSWWGSKDITISNLKMIEEPTLTAFHLPAKTSALKKDGLNVVLDDAFPRIISYSLNGKTMLGQEEIRNTVLINGKKYIPSVTSTLNAAGDTRTYIMKVDEIGVEINATYKLDEHHVVLFNINEIKETKDFKVTSFAFDQNAFAYTDSGSAQSSYAWTKSNGQWHGVSEELTNNTSEMDKSETIGTTFAIVSANGLAASMENNIMSGGNKTIITKEKKQLIQKASLSSGTWTYRYDATRPAEALPWAKIVITEDANDDKKTDWQDGAVAYREYIFNKPFEAQDMANNMMYIAFNFASQANDPFLNTLETGKVLYNYTDGFGQMILHKGYQGEGHDDDIPSYSNIGVRQGGIKDFNKLIDEGSKYNLNIGVHLNATEYHLDANELKYGNLTGSSTGNLSGGWDWIDTAYYVDQTKEVLDGSLQKRFKDLYDLTKDPSNPNDPALDFYYVDVYTGNDYNASKLVEYADSLGLKVGTEFSGPIEPGVSFVHWGPDLGYPNKGNKSILSRMVKNEMDLFVGNALFKGQKIPGVTTWGDSKPDVQQGVTVFNNEVLPTKFMQHHGVLKYEEDKITFGDGVTSERNKTTKMVELKQDGKLVSSWADTGTTQSENVRHTGEATSLIPWKWDVKTNKVLSLDEGAKMYHWNPQGGTTTWELTDDFKGASSFTLYELTQEGKVNRGIVQNVNGSVTIDAQKNTPYILYKTGAKTIEDASDWGEGSAVKDFAFNAESIDGTTAWNHKGDATIKIVEGRKEYSIDKEMNNSYWNRYAQLGSEGELTQSLDFNNLVPGNDYTISVWSEVANGATSTLEVKIGDKVYKNSVTGMDKNHQSSFKYVGTNWQRLSVEFHVPNDAKTGSIALKGNGGTVKYDDVKVWHHTTNEKDVRNEGYVIKEDFENTYEGWGPFEYGGGSRKISITTDKSNPLDNNDVVAKDSGQFGPVMTWVLGGENSLKINETDLNRSVKTNENMVKLAANRTFTLSFDYTLEEHAGYEVLVKSRKTGNVIFREDLKNLANNGETKKDSAAYIHFEKEFTTDDNEDYQVIFNENRADRYGEDNDKVYPSQTYSLILDNFAISITSQRAELQKLYDEYAALDKNLYTSASWAIFETSLAHAKTILDNPTSSAEVIDKEIIDLQAAKAKLVKETSIADLTELVKTSEKLLSEEEHYSSVTWDAFESALMAAKQLISKPDGIPGSQIALTYKALEDAKLGLVNIQALQNAITVAERIKNDNYTSSSWNNFADGLKEAKALLKSATSEKQVSGAQTRLQQLIQNLVKKGSIEALQGLVNKANQLSQADYTAATWRVFESELTNAKTFIATNDAPQKEIDDMYKSLESAMKSLQRLATTIVDKDSGISVRADNGVLPEGTTLSVEIYKSSSTLYKAVMKALQNKVNKMMLYDIQLHQETKEMVVNGKVIVQIPNPKGYDKQKLALYEVGTDGSVTLISAQVSGSNILFEKGKNTHVALVELKDQKDQPDTNKPGVDKDPSTGDTTQTTGLLAAGILSLGALAAFKRKKKESKE